MEELAVRILVFIYLGILCLSILIAAFQYATERTTPLRSALFYWFGLTISTVTNGLVMEAGFPLILIASIGTFISQTFLGSFFAELNGLVLNRKRLLVFYLGTLLGSFLLFLSGVSFETYAFPILIGCSWPVPASLLLVHRRKNRPLPTVQKIFVVVAIMMSLHYLDWAFFKVRPHLYVLAFGVAVALLYLLAMLMPMMSNEMILRHRNDLLEDEVKDKVAQLTETERELWEANKLASLGRMAGGMAHELNTPLQIIEFQTEELRALVESRSASTKGDVAEGLSRIQNMVQRIAGITEALRHLAREVSTQNLQTIDLREVVLESLSNFKGKADAVDIKLIVALPNEPLMVVADRQKILRVFSSLIDNAIQAVSPLAIREVIVRGAKAERKVEVSVQDSGRISPEIVPKLMEPFFTTKPVGEGVGLGLSTSKSIVETHGGTLSLDVDSPTTRFVVELPLGPQ